MNGGLGWLRAPERAEFSAFFIVCDGFASGSFLRWSFLLEGVTVYEYMAIMIMKAMMIMMMIMRGSLLSVSVHGTFDDLPPSLITL